jgi:hypothetical protein
MKLFGLIASMALLCAGAAAQQNKPPETTSPRSQELSGSKTIVGCLERSGDGFAVRTDSDVYPLNTERDLSAYVGKKVQLSQSWTAKGTVTATPMVGGEAQGEAAAAVPKGRPGAFSGDFNLHVEGTVIGECTPKQ